MGIFFFFVLKFFFGYGNQPCRFFCFEFPVRVSFLYFAKFEFLAGKKKSPKNEHLGFTLTEKTNHILIRNGKFFGYFIGHTLDLQEKYIQKSFTKILICLPVVPNWFWEHYITKK